MNRVFLFIVIAFFGASCLAGGYDDLQKLEQKEACFNKDSYAAQGACYNGLLKDAKGFLEIELKALSEYLEGDNLARLNLAQGNWEKFKEAECGFSSPPHRPQGQKNLHL